MQVSGDEFLAGEHGGRDPLNIYTDNGVPCAGAATQPSVSHRPSQMGAVGIEHMRLAVFAAEDGQVPAGRP